MPTPPKSPPRRQIVITLPTARGVNKALPRLLGFAATVTIALVAGHAVEGIDWFASELEHALIGSGIAFAASFWLREVLEPRR